MWLQPLNRLDWIDKRTNFYAHEAEWIGTELLPPKLTGSIPVVGTNFVVFVVQYIDSSSNGRTRGFGPLYQGSNPCESAK